MTSSLALPRQIGAVRLSEPLGEGGMALVWKGTDLYRPGREVAVKLLRPEVHANADLVRRFLREGEVLSRLSHPNLVEIFAFGKAGAWPYLILELLPGGSVKACRGEAPATFVRRLLPVARALHVAHGAGVVHRDLKPSNLLFAADGLLKATDFGVCLWEGSDATRATGSQMVVGTLGYMAPEQHGDPRRVDRRCDVYALGAILYEYATGQAYAQALVPPAQARSGFPPRLARILLESLAPDPGRRTPDMLALADQLEAWLDTAEAAGWGEEPLPGFGSGDRERPTEVGTRTAVAEAPEARLGPYLDALGTSQVGTRRAAAEGLRQSARPADGPWLLEALDRAPDTARFALALALGDQGGEEALEPLARLLGDPYCQREAAEALGRLGARLGLQDRALARLGEPGLGSPWRWAARAALGDGAWAKAVASEWPRLSPPQRLQALEAARQLPPGPRAELRARLEARPEPRGGALAEALGLL